MEFQIEDAGEFSPDEADLAKKHWSNRGVVPFYTDESHWAAHMAEQIIALNPKRVFEFGCNVGRNLAAIAKRKGDIALTGCDINQDAVRFGQTKFGLNLIASDEHLFDSIATDEFDVSFTVSVLDHLPEPQNALNELLRISRLGVLLLEPWLESEGKVVRNSRADGEMVDTTPFSYSWDYERLAADTPYDVALLSEPYPLSKTNLGSKYHLYRLMHRGKNAAS